ncbi:MAG TPA: hypothetical protein ENK52_01245 [Saprospiraceae bacterium]|nr:hypothetical protein [Saprospiraceae bacterium]
MSENKKYSNSTELLINIAAINWVKNLLNEYKGYGVGRIADEIRRKGKPLSKEEKKIYGLHHSLTIGRDFWDRLSEKGKLQPKKSATLIIQEMLENKNVYDTLEAPDLGDFEPQIKISNKAWLFITGLSVIVVSLILLFRQDPEITRIREKYTLAMELCDDISRTYCSPYPAFEAAEKLKKLEVNDAEKLLHLAKEKIIEFEVLREKTRIIQEKILKQIFNATDDELRDILYRCKNEIHKQAREKFKPGASWVEVHFLDENISSFMLESVFPEALMSSGLDLSLTTIEDRIKSVRMSKNIQDVSLNTHFGMMVLTETLFSDEPYKEFKNFDCDIGLNFVVSTVVY